MRRVPHPQPSSFNPPVYGREKLRSVSFTTQLRPVSLSSNNTQVKQTAHECMLELLTNAGQEGMDIERLARKVTVAVFKKFGCKSFAENVFLELVNQSPFRREVRHVLVSDRPLKIKVSRREGSFSTSRKKKRQRILVPLSHHPSPKSRWRKRGSL